MHAASYCGETECVAALIQAGETATHDIMLNHSFFSLYMYVQTNDMSVVVDSCWFQYAYDAW